MRLRELQHNFQQYLMADDVDTTVVAEITPIVSGDVTERLNIYHHAYRSRVREALSTQFPQLSKLLGTHDFNQLMDEFIARYPSPHRNMRWLGDKLSHFLHEYAPDKPILCDMANFEWQLGCAFDSQDIATLTIHDLSAFSPEQWADLAFDWHPSVYLGKSQTNVIRVWMLLEDNDNSNVEVALEPSDYSEPTDYLVWRKELVSQFKSLSKLEANAIAYMMQNHTFGELCDYLTAHMDEESVLPYAAGLLSDWLQQDMLVKVALKTDIHHS